MTPSGFSALNSLYAAITCQTHGYQDEVDVDDDDDDTRIDDFDDADLLFREIALDTEHLHNVPVKDHQ